MTLVAYTNIEDGVSADANVWNSRFGDILAVLNGNIDASNIKNGSITRELFASDAISAAWPVGSVYISVENVNPGPQLGGTWVAFATGRTLVGVDAAQTEFNSVEKTGGHKALQSHTHAGTTSSNGAHGHGVNSNLTRYSGGSDEVGLAQGGYKYLSSTTFSSDGAHTHSFTTASTGGGDSQNLQPYITVYFWKRVS